MNKFTRTDNVHRSEGGTLPANRSHRLFGDAVSVGEPLQIQGDADLRRDIQTSLEVLAKERLLEAEAEANQIIAKAKLDAKALLEKANAQAKEILGQMDQVKDAAHEAGFKAGFQEGYADATEQVEQETVDLLRGANTLVEAAHQAEKLVLKHFERQALGIISHMSRKIVRRELTDASEKLMGMVRDAIESLYISGKVQVVVSPQLIHDLRQFATTTGNAVDGMNRFEFIADPGLDPYQIFIVGQDGCFDLSPDRQIDQLISVLEPHITLPRLETDAIAISAPPPEILENSEGDVLAPMETVQASIETNIEDFSEASVISNKAEAPLLPTSDPALLLPEETGQDEAETKPVESPQAMPFDFPTIDSLSEQDGKAGPG